MRRALAAAALALLALPALAQHTGHTAALRTPAGGAVGDVTAVGDCLTGNCFQAAAAFTFFAAPPAGGVAAFRAITVDDLPAALTTDLELTAAIAAHAGAAAAHHAWPLTDAEIPDALTLAAASVTAHEAALAIDWTQLGSVPAGLADGDDDTFAGYTPTGADLEVVTGTPGATNDCAKWNPDGDLVSAGAACGAGGGGPAGSGSELQYRSDATTFGAVIGSSVSGGEVTLGSGSTNGLRLGTYQAIREGSGQTFGAAGSYMQFLTRGSATAGFGWFTNQANPYATLAATSLQFSFRSGMVVGWSSSATDSSLSVDLGLVRHASAHLRVTDGSSGGGAISARAYVSEPASQTCTDNGAGSASSLTVTVSGASYVALTNADANGCAITLSETGATNGQRLEIVIVSNAGGSVTFADTTGVSETAGAFAAGAFDSITYRYASDRWVEVSRSDN